MAWTFAAVGAVVAQLTTGAGTARVIGLVVLGIAFLLRGVGDISAQGGGGLGWISWLSPLSWGAQLRPFSGERWWVLGIVLCADTALIAAAVALSRRSDIGSGLLAERAGPAVAAPGLRSPLALAWRLNRGSLASWIILCVVIGVAIGGIATSIGDLLTNSSAAVPGKPSHDWWGRHDYRPVFLGDDPRVHSGRVASTRSSGCCGSGTKKAVAAQSTCSPSRSSDCVGQPATSA